MAPQPELSRMEASAARALLSGVTELCSLATHDVVGPLNQAGSLVALFVSRYSNRLDPEADELLEFLGKSSTRLQRIVAGLRRYLEVAGRPQNFERVGLNTALDSALVLLEDEILESGAVIVSESLPFVWADADRLVTIFELLISNSIQFRRQDVPPRIQISSVHGGTTVGVAVTDNGIGIDPVFCESVLLPFMRLNGAKHASAGLGLATAKLIAEMHGGSIRIEPLPKDSVGACVRVTLCGAV